MSRPNRPARIRPFPGERPTTRALFTRRFLLLLVSQAGFGYAFSSFFLLPKFLATELAAGPSQIGALTAVTGLLTVFLMIATGLAVDRFGRRPLLILGNLLMASSSLAFAFIDEMGAAIYLLRGLQALAFSMVYVAGAAMTVDLAPDERLAEALGYFSLTGLSMNAIAPTVVESLAAGPGWGGAFLSAAGATLVCALLSCLLRETRSGRPPGRIDLGLRDSLRDPRQRAAIAVMALIGAAFASMFVYHQLYALELGISHVSGFFIAYSVSAIAARVGLGALGDRWGRRRASIAALFLYAASLFAMLDLPRLGLTVIGAAFGLAHGVFYPTYSALVLERIPAELRGRTVALLQAWFNGGVAASAFGLGSVAEHAGYAAVFAIAGSCAAFAALVVLWPAVRESAARRASLTGDSTAPPALERS